MAQAADRGRDDLADRRYSMAAPSWADAKFALEDVLAAIELRQTYR